MREIWKSGKSQGKPGKQGNVRENLENREMSGKTRKCQGKPGNVRENLEIR